MRDFPLLGSGAVQGCLACHPRYNTRNTLDNAATGFRSLQPSVLKSQSQSQSKPRIKLRMKVNMKSTRSSKSRKIITRGMDEPSQQCTKHTAAPGLMLCRTNAQVFDKRLPARVYGHRHSTTALTSTRGPSSPLTWRRGQPWKCTVMRQGRIERLDALMRSSSPLIPTPTPSSAVPGGPWSPLRRPARRSNKTPVGRCLLVSDDAVGVSARGGNGASWDRSHRQRGWTVESPASTFGWGGTRTRVIPPREKSEKRVVVCRVIYTASKRER